MKEFQEMLRAVTNSPYFNQMLRDVAPLNEHFGINHFWYYRITDCGEYSYFGSHSAWSEYCFNEGMTSSFPCLRHPNIATTGVSLMKSFPGDEYQKTLQVAWDKFQINFHLNLVQRLPDGVEAFGFASRFNDPQADERLLNELPLLSHFTKTFREKNAKLFDLAYKNSVNLVQTFGTSFYERPKAIVFPLNRDDFLRKIGLEWIFLLSPRERDVLNLLSSGYPASYIGAQLDLSTRTVENYTTTMKSKLGCSTKTELIGKAKEASEVYRFSSAKLNR